MGCWEVRAADVCGWSMREHHVPEIRIETRPLHPCNGRKPLETALIVKSHLAP